MILAQDDCVTVLAGFDGGMWSIDPATLRLVGRQPTPPIGAAAYADGIWAVVAGEATGGQGEPPVWMNAGTDELVRITGGSATCRLSGEIGAVFAGGSKHELWCAIGPDGAVLERVDSRTGRAAGTFDGAPGASFRHVDPDARVAFAVARTRSAAMATVIAYRLPPAAA